MAIAHILKPAPEGGAPQLFLLFCDAGQSWQEMTPLGEALGKAFGSAAIVALQGPHAVGEDHGWLDPTGETQAGETQAGVADTPMEGRALLTAWEDEALAGAVEAALPGCIGSIRSWQAQMKVLPEATALIGVGEGATMALAAAMASAGDGHPVCGRVSTVGGRFGPVPDAVSPTLVLHLVHGKADQNVHFRHSVKTAEDLVKRDADVMADIVPHEGHALSDELVGWLVDRLQSRVPRHLWQAAMRVQGAGPTLGDLVQRGVVEDDIGRHTAVAGLLTAPAAQTIEAGTPRRVQVTLQRGGSAARALA